MPTVSVFVLEDDAEAEVDTVDTGDTVDTWIVIIAPDVAIEPVATVKSLVGLEALANTVGIATKNATRISKTPVPATIRLLEYNSITIFDLSNSHISFE